MVPLPKKGGKSLPFAKNSNKLFAKKAVKFKLLAKGRYLAPFAGNETKVKLPFELKVTFNLLSVID